MGSDEIHLSDPISPTTKKLNNNKNCPIIGLGTDRLIQKEMEYIEIIKKQNLDDENKKIDEIKKDIENVIYQSIIDGVRLIDTSQLSEELVGRVINRVINEGIVLRNQLFIVAKLELDEKENPEEALKETLKRLGNLSYVDLYLDHWPSCINYKNPNKSKLISVRETWEKMEKLVNSGLAKSIGVCNYNVENLLNILSICKIKPAVIEVEFHPYLFQKDLKEICEYENITIFAYNPLTKGKYKDKFNPLDIHYNILRDGQITYLMNKYEKNKKFREMKITRGQIVLNWHMCLKIIPIVGTVKPDRMKENLNAMKFSLDEKTVNLLSSFEDKRHRFCDGSEIFGINIFA